MTKLGRLEGLLPGIRIMKGQTLLEIGCGSGFICSHMAEKYRLKVVGVDLDPAMIQIAHSNFGKKPNTRFIVMDATKLDFADGEFDLVLSFGVMHHIPNWQEALSEVSRVLKPGGVLIFGDLAYSRFTARMVRRFSQSLGGYTIDEVAALLRTKGLEMVHAPRGRGILKWYDRIFRKD
jgi:ubiquinone/menaquinone biosynthesis C-methylase UbiE